jgi:hypothetical protein
MRWTSSPIGGIVTGVSFPQAWPVRPAGCAGPDDDEDGARQGGGEQYRIVDLGQALVEEVAEALEVEQLLGDQVTGQ